MNPYELILHNEEETEQLGHRLADRLQAGDSILLEGDLGAGKTRLTQAIGRGLGVTIPINSPTFTIIKEYEGRLPLYHMDAYRLEDEDEMLGLEEYMDGDGVFILEWPMQIASQLPPEYLLIRLEHIDGDKRQLRAFPNGERYEQLCKEIFS